MKADDYRKAMNDRALRIGKYMVDTRDTLKKIAKEFNCSPSNVRRLIREVLPALNPKLANQCHTIIEYHKAIAHIRGGEGNKIRIRKEKKSTGTTESVQ